MTSTTIINHIQLAFGHLSFFEQRYKVIPNDNIKDNNMKIALLNLPVDNNYGGNLQRYALMKVLENMGHDVTHINLRRRIFLPWYKKPYSYTKRILQKLFLDKNINLNIENELNKQLMLSEKITDSFYYTYINHTDPCYNIHDVKKVARHYDSVIVGSDQVWRRDMAVSIPFEDYFLKFVKKGNKIAYAVSSGSEIINIDNINKYKKLYENFSGVSVREKHLIDFFSNNGFNIPKPVLVLDPTLLLDKQYYFQLMNRNDVNHITKGKIYCYILDLNTEIEERIRDKANELGCDYIISGINNVNNTISIEQWLVNIYDAQFVFTDSYHGSIFSLIFHKKFIYCGNKRRGNKRIESLFNIFNIHETDRIDYVLFESIKQEMTDKSLNFLKTSISNG